MIDNDSFVMPPQLVPPPAKWTVHPRTDYYKESLGVEAPPLVLKVMAADGRSPYMQYVWPLPVDGLPGDWVQAAPGEIVTCDNGLHFTTPEHLSAWLGGGEGLRLFVAEIEPPYLDALPHANKLVVGRARLVREIDGLQLATKRAGFGEVHISDKQAIRRLPVALRRHRCSPEQAAEILETLERYPSQGQLTVAMHQASDRYEIMKARMVIRRKVNEIHRRQGRARTKPFEGISKAIEKERVETSYLSRVSQLLYRVTSAPSVLRYAAFHVPTRTGMAYVDQNALDRWERESVAGQAEARAAIAAELGVDFKVLWP